jgi:putative ABC transport system substrate-binding protein
MAAAQESGRVYRVGYLYLGTAEGTPHNRIGAFREGMRELGYIEGKNLVIETRHGNGDTTRLAGAAEALVALKVDVILTSGTGATLAAKSATRDIPIVFGSAGDPVGRGIVASLAHPGGNVTGFAVDLTTTKILEVLKEVVPTARRVGFPYSEANIPPHYRGIFLEERMSAAQALGMELIPRRVISMLHLPTWRTGPPTPYFLNQDAMIAEHRVRVMALALRHRLPTICYDRQMVEAGCLVAYGEDYSELYRRAARYVDKVLKGAHPADLPVEQPTRITLVLNTKTAQALGLTFSPAILARADEEIE